MAVLGQNNCSPARIYGPLPQTVFCGCSVISFNVSAGWNEQSSSMTIELVQDTCAGPRVWWDESLARQSSVSTTDPGFTFPEPGVPAYFRIEEDPDGGSESARGGFEYAGIVEGWTQRNDPNGNPVYTVKLVDPRVIIENVQCIVNDFPGTTSGVWNLINAYGYVESLGSTCTSSPAGAIGGVTWDNLIGNQANSRGMVWNDVRCAVSTLTAANDQTLAASLYGGYCRDARIVYVGPAPAEDGYGIIERDGLITDPAFQTIPNANLNVCDYLLDLTEIPFSPLYYRISGPNVSLMEMISTVCQDAGCDYYIELLPVRNAGKVIKVIKVRVAVRSTQPTLGILDDFINARAADAAAANGGVLSYTQGEEVRNEDTSTYLIGGALRQAFEAEAANMLPFWGVDTNGDMINASVVSDEYRVRLDLSRLNVTLNTPFASQYAWLTERELRAALHDMDAWTEVALFVNLDFATWLATVNRKKRFRHDLLARALDAGDDGLPAKAINVGGVAAIDEADQKDIEKTYDFVRSYADEFYGKQWLVNATSFVCFTTDLESQKLRYSHEPSTEGCWVNDGTSTIIGLVHDSTASDFFRDEQGKYQPIVKFPLIAAQRIGGGAFSYVADPSKLGDDNYITDGVDEIWVKADVDERWVFGTPLAPASSIISFLLKTGAPVTNRTSDANELKEPFGALDALMDGAALPRAEVNIQDRGQFALGSLNFALAPSAALAPTWNHVQVYGPWGVVGLPGQVQLETDEGFVPWEYGSDNIMYQAAFNKVASSVTQMRKGERGSVSVAGFPNIPIGAELFSVDTASPPNSQGNQKYVGTRTYSISQCAPTLPYIHVPMNAWTGEFGPNVTSVTVNVGPNGFTTEYQFSTYTPAFGRFNKDNAERLKLIGQTRLSNMRNMRAQVALRRQVGASIARGRQILMNQLGRSDEAPKSAHHMFVGRYVGSNDRNEIATHSSRELTLAISNTGVYSNTAIMSHDGLFRPVSKNGDGGFSPFVTYSTNYCTDLPDKTKQSDPPIKEYTRLSVTQLYLDALANPSGSLPTNRSDTPASGHDIEVLARGTTPPLSGWAITEGSDDGAGYTADYRFFALRGPVFIQQWGYDDCGKPIPNKADSVSNAENGIFTETNLEDKFLDGWLQQPKTWPMAPLDLRLDRERGVWTTPQPPRPLHANSTGVCLLTYENCVVTNSKTVYDSAGSVVASKTIDVNWPWSQQPPTGIGKLPAYYDNVDCNYYAFPINRLDVACSTGASPNQEITDTYYDIKRIIFDCGAGTGTGCSSSSSFQLLTDFDTCKRDIYVSISGGGGIEVTGSQKDDLCDTQGSSLGGSYNSIQFTGALSLTEGDNCQVVVSGIPGAYASGLEIDSSACRPIASDVAKHPFEVIRFGTGLQVYDEGPECYTTVHGAYRIKSLNTCSKTGTTAMPFEQITLGTGLDLIRPSNGCDVRIDTTMCASGRTLTGTDLCATAGGTDFAKKFECIGFEGNLSLSVKDDCTVLVSGAPTPINFGGDSVCGRSSVATFDAATLLVSTGIQIEETEDCVAKISTTHCVTGTTLTGTICEAGGTSFNQRFEKLQFAGNLSSSSVDDCTVLVSGRATPIGISGLDIDGGACRPVAPAVAKFDAECIAYGTGLQVIDNGDCTATIHGAYRIKELGTCGNTPSVTTAIPFELLVLGTGLQLSRDSNGCDVQIDSRHSVRGWDGSGCQTDTGVEIPCSTFECLTFGTGLTLTSLGDCDYVVNAHNYVSGEEWCGGSSSGPFRYVTLVAGSGLDVEQISDCEVRLKTSHNISGTNHCGFDNTDQGGFFKDLLIGTGLEVSAGDNDCQWRIDSRIQAQGWDSECGYTSNMVDKARFECLIFGTGLKSTHTPGTCTWQVDGIVPQYSGDNACGRDTVAPISATNIVLSTGLKLEQGDDCQVIISSEMNITGLSTACRDGAGQNEGGKFTTLNLGSGLSLNMSECTATIASPQYLSGIMTCGRAASDSVFFDTLALGTGLSFSKRNESGCSYAINVNISFTGHDSPCGSKNGTGGKVYETIEFGDGLVATEQGDCGLLITSPITVSGLGGTCYSSVAATNVANLVFSGLEVTATDTGTCEVTIGNIQKLRKIDFCGDNDPGETGGGGGGGGGGGESDTSFSDFKYLSFGSGIRVISAGDCEYEIHAGVKVQHISCSYLGQSTPDAIPSWTTNLMFGPGLSVSAVSGTATSCSTKIHNPISVSMCDQVGQTQVYDSNCETGNPINSFICTNISGCAGVDDDCGPYCQRKPPQYIESLHAGYGIGFDSCSNCDLIIFNNMRVIGIDATDPCNSVTYGQVGKLQFNGTFDIGAGIDTTNECDDLDAERHAVIGFSNAGPWSIDYVCDIDITTNAGYVTDVTWTCNSLGGFKTCAGDLIVSSTGSPCECG